MIVQPAERLFKRIKLLIESFKFVFGQPLDAERQRIITESDELHEPLGAFHHRRRATLQLITLQPLGGESVFPHRAVHVHEMDQAHTRQSPRHARDTTFEHVNVCSDQLDRPKHRSHR